MTDEQIVQLDPTKILADDNSRWSPKPRETDVQRLMDSILEHGGVMEPVEVTELDKADRKNGFTHRLVFGFNRHAAVSRLNIEQNAGLTLPAIVRLVETEQERVKRQVAENNDRATLSAMDKSVAIKRLLDTGLAKADVRRIFSASGGRKGAKVQPMSNAMLNIHLNLLELPKPIQEDIHLGLIGVEGAYQLGKVPADKRQAVIDRAKKDRETQIAQEEKDEARFVAAEARVVETEAKVKTVEAEVETAKAEVSVAEEMVKARIEEMKAVKVAIANMETPAGPDEVEAIKAAEANVRAAQKLLKEAKNKVSKVAGDRTKAQEAVEAVKAKLEANRAAMKGKKVKGIGKKAVTKAAQAEGTKAGYVPINIGDIRQFMKDLVGGKIGADDRIARIASCFKSCFDGKDTEKETVAALNTLLDAMGARLPKPVAAPAPAMPAAPDVKQGPKTAKK